MIRDCSRWGTSAALLLALAGCGGAGGARQREAMPVATQHPGAPAACDASADRASLDATTLGLAQAYASVFAIGAAISRSVYAHQDPAAAALVAAQFNRVTAENAMKWESTEPSRNNFTFTDADRYAAYAKKNNLQIHEHALVWHQQVPGWIFQNAAGGPATRAQLLDRLEQHMRALADHFGGRVRYWDVVNEAIEDDGSLRETPWRTIIGDDYVEQAFRLADRHFPDAKLVYNDFSMEKPGKRDAVVALVQAFKARGVRIDAVGTQAHFQLTTPTLEAIDASLAAFANTGVEVLVSELDVDVLPPAYQNQGADLALDAELSAELNPYPDCLPSDVAARAAQRWADLFGVFSRHSARLHSVTLWGVSDAHSWLNDWPVKGRTNYPLLFDRQLRAKRAWQSVIQAAGKPAKPSR